MPTKVNVTGAEKHHLESETVVHTDAGATAGAGNVDVVGTSPYYHYAVVNFDLRASQGPSAGAFRANLTHPTPRVISVASLP